MCYVLLASTYLLCEQHIRLLDTTVGTFLGSPFEVYGSRANKRWSEEGTVSPVVSKSLICCSHNITQFIVLILHDAQELSSTSISYI